MLAGQLRMSSFTIAEKGVDIFPSTETTAPTIYLNTFSGEGQKIYEAARAANYPQFALVAISDLDWNHDMAPWDCPPAFKNAAPCTGGAEDYLGLLTEEIIPKAERNLPSMPRWRGIVGYSLGTHSIRRICFPVQPACPVPCGFPG